MKISLLKRLFFIFLFFLQIIALGDYTRPLERSKNLVLEFQSLQDYQEQIDLVSEIYKNKDLYNYIKSILASLLTIDPEQAQKFALQSKSDGVSEPQLLFLLQNFPEWSVTLKDYINEKAKMEASDSNLSADEKMQLALEFNKMRLQHRKYLREQMRLEKVQLVLSQMADPTRAFIARLKGQPQSFSLQTFVNHPYYQLNKSVTKLSDFQSKNSKIAKEDDLKAVALKFIRSAKKSIHFNFFEFDLVDVAQEIMRMSDYGIAVRGGIDAKTTVLKASNVKVAALFRSQAVAHSNFEFTEVQSSGLNHQKIIVKDAGTPEAEVLFLSGNMTQSCVGPEGDLVGVKNTIHQGKSKPNANNALLVKQPLIATMTAHELDKILVKKYRGQRHFPVSGSYVFENIKSSTQNDWLLLAFSPNGGTGDVGRDTLNTLIRSEERSVWAMQFAFSSSDILVDLIDKMRKRVVLMTDNIPDSQQIIPEVAFTGDPSFSLREWAVPLKLSGYAKNIQTSKFYVDQESPLFQGLTAAQLKLMNEEFKKIRVSTQLFGDFHFLGGLKASVKLHHKFFSLPAKDITTTGTSFNTSNSAEGNMEQIVITQDKDVARKMNGAFLYLYAKSNKSVIERALDKNKQKNLDGEDEEKMTIIEEQIIENQTDSDDNN